jgi:hypothetical protein
VKLTPFVRALVIGSQLDGVACDLDSERTRELRREGPWCQDGTPAPKDPPRQSLWHTPGAIRSANIVTVPLAYGVGP